MNEVKPSDAEAAAPRRSFKEKRERFFAEREAFFLWLLAPPVLVLGAVMLITLLLWLARQAGLLATVLGSSQP